MGRTADVSVPCVDWEGLPPHDFLDWRVIDGKRRAKASIRETAEARAERGRGRYREALRAEIARRYALCIFARETCRETGRAWALEDVGPAWESHVKAALEGLRQAKEDA